MRYGLRWLRRRRVGLQSSKPYGRLARDPKDPKRTLPFTWQVQLYLIARDRTEKCLGKRGGSADNTTVQVAAPRTDLHRQDILRVLNIDIPDRILRTYFDILTAFH